MKLYYYIYIYNKRHKAYTQAQQVTSVVCNKLKHNTENKLQLSLPQLSDELLKSETQNQKPVPSAAP
jgi:hypothetical protein